MELPPFPRYKENPSKALTEIKDFPSRSSDIFICASLKSGMVIIAFLDIIV
jgi:hypothetical protein